MFTDLIDINTRPEPFQFYTAAELWTNDHTAEQMLSYHLNESVDLSSRNRGFIEKSVQWISTRFNVNSTTKIADFGCGPGLYANRLAGHGAQVTGIDFSENSLNYARKAAQQDGLDIEYIHANYLEFTTSKSFDIILMIMCDFSALSPNQRKVLLGKFHTLLNPGGVVVLDVQSLNFFNQRKEAATYELNQLNGFWSSEDYYCFLNSFKYDKEKVLLDKYTIVEQSRKRVVYNWLQCFSADSLRAEFEENGFVVEQIFSDVAGASYSADSSEIAVVARKL